MSESVILVGIDLAWLMPMPFGPRKRVHSRAPQVRARQVIAGANKIPMAAFIFLQRACDTLDSFCTLANTKAASLRGSEFGFPSRLTPPKLAWLMKNFFRALQYFRPDASRIVVVFLL